MFRFAAAAGAIRRGTHKDGQPGARTSAGAGPRARRPLIYLAWDLSSHTPSSRVPLLARLISYTHFPLSLLLELSSSSSRERGEGFMKYILLYLALCFYDCSHWEPTLVAACSPSRSCKQGGPKRSLRQSMQRLPQAAPRGTCTDGA